MPPPRSRPLHSLDRHSAWLSPAALAACGLADHPTELLWEHEAWQALLRLPSAGAEEDDGAVREAVAAAHGRGLTALRDVSVEHAHAQWERLRDAGARSRCGSSPC